MKLLLLSILVCLAGPAPQKEAAGVLKEIAERLEKGHAASFRFRLEGKVQMTGQAEVCADTYHAVLGDTEIYGSPQARYTIDHGEKEVYVETPADLLKIVTEITELQADKDSITGTYAKDTRFTINSILWLGQMNPFVFDPAALSSDWLVTDLR